MSTSAELVDKFKSKMLKVHSLHSSDFKGHVDILSDLYVDAVRAIDSNLTEKELKEAAVILLVISELTTSLHEAIGKKVLDKIPKQDRLNVIEQSQKLVEKGYGEITGQST